MYAFFRAVTIIFVASLAFRGLQETVGDVIDHREKKKDKSDDE